MLKRVNETIPEPYEDVVSLRRSVVALKEVVETLTGQRGVPEKIEMLIPISNANPKGAAAPVLLYNLDRAVTIRDLLDYGLIKPEQVTAKSGPQTYAMPVES